MLNFKIRADSSRAERLHHKQEVVGSSPTPPNLYFFEDKIMKKDCSFSIFPIPHAEKINEFLLKYHKVKNGGIILGIGALKDPIIAFYNPKKKKYIQKKFKGQFEMTSLIGNVTFFKGKPLLHLHVNLSNSKFQTFSGHLVEAQVSGTCEIVFFPFKRRILKEIDPKTGLKILKINQ